MSAAPLDPAAIVDEHTPLHWAGNTYNCEACGRLVNAEGCLPYRLAAELIALQSKLGTVAEPTFPLARRFRVGERCLIPGYSGSYPSHKGNKWGHVTDIRRVVETKVREELVVTLDGEEPRAINPDVVAHGDDWRYKDKDPALVEGA